MTLAENTCIKNLFHLKKIEIVETWGNFSLKFTHKLRALYSFHDDMNHFRRTVALPFPEKPQLPSLRTANYLY